MSPRWQHSTFRRRNPSSPPAPGAHLGRYTRGYLPHADFPLLHSVTFRLHDSVPAEAIRRWRAEAERDPSLQDDRQRAREVYERIARYEDAGRGACWLARPEIATIVCRALRHFHGTRYQLHEWCVMPNHVHVLLRLPDETALGDVVKSWKAYTARMANRILERRGPFWMRDYHDRFIRSDAHYGYTRGYIQRNPVAAGLCKRPIDWPWSSCSRQPGYR